MAELVYILNAVSYKARIGETASRIASIASMISTK
jgi:hypothetical protein